MPSDLNLKKSWNPKLIKNREKVWEKEREILNEYKKSQQHNAKSKEISEKNELLSLAKSLNEPSEKRDVKTSWMYNSPNIGNGKDEGFDEDVLLGKRKIDNLSSLNKNKDKSSRMDKIIKHGLEKKSEEPMKDTAIGTGTVDKYAELEKMSKSDPLYKIKLKELQRQEQLEKQKKLMKNVKKDKKERDGDLHGKTASSHRSRDSSYTRNYSHRQSTNRYESKTSERHPYRSEGYRSSREYDPERRSHSYRDRR